MLLDVPVLEQQLLGLVWRAGKIDHPNGEHDDFSNAGCGALVVAKELIQGDPANYEMDDVEREQVYRAWGHLADEEPSGEFDENVNMWGEPRDSW
jgi:hypothetical protein